MKNKINNSIFVFITGLLSLFATMRGQNPCYTNNPAIKYFLKVQDTVKINSPFVLDIGAVDNTPCLDTLYTKNITITKLSGAGSITGNLSINAVKGRANFINLIINTIGVYQFNVHSGTLRDTTFKIVASLNGGSGGGGLPCIGGGPSVKLKFNNVPPNANVNSPFGVKVLALGSSNCIDTTYTATVMLTKLVGPGILSGTTSVNFFKGMAQFNNLSFNQPGAYRIIASSAALIKDTTMNINLTAGGGGGGGGNPCPPTSSVGKRNNMGLYGGSSLDLSFSGKNNRLFAAISSPASLFYSDDLCATWKRSFPDDSLEYGCGKGWGGRAVRVLTNTKGWVAVQTSQEAGTLNALVVSYANGDSGTWKTAMDAKMLASLGLNSANVSGMGLSDYYLYCLMGKYIIRINNTSSINMSTDVVNVTTAIAGAHINSTVKSVAVANSSGGYPIYCVIDTVNFGTSAGSSVYKYNGTSFTKLTLPVGMSGASAIFTHPGQNTGDTLFLNGRVGANQKTYLSYNGGATWTDISFSGPGNWSLTDVDYSPAWKSSMTASNGCVLLIPGAAISNDLGATWQNFNLQNNGGAVHPTTPSTIVGTKGRGVVVSTTGAGGAYTMPANFGLEAVTIKKIARTKAKGIFYIATKAGLAYTKAYSDTNVVGYNKWNAPYGEFPVNNVGDDAGVFSVAIDPKDSLHVIAGYSNGFAVTKTGVSGFSNVMPAGWNNTDDPRANDILFVNSSVVIAVSGGDNQIHMGKGNIWRSENGGSSWTKVSPVGFSNGNTIAMGTTHSDSILYIGTGLFAGGSHENGVLWKSIDKGLTWTKVNDGPTSSTNPSVTKMPIYDLAVDPRGKDTLYIASGSNLNHAFVKSKDGGLTYQTIKAHGEGAFTSVAINQFHPDTVYMAIRRDVMLYDAAHDSVNYIYRGLPGELVPDLSFGSVLAGTSMGFFKIKEGYINHTVSIQTQTVLNLDEMKAYPNPFNNHFSISFASENHSLVKIKLYDLTGRELKSIYNGILNEGQHVLSVNTDGLPEGTYLISLVTDKKTICKRIVKVQ